MDCDTPPIEMTVEYPSDWKYSTICQQIGENFNRGGNLVAGVTGRPGYIWIGSKGDDYIFRKRTGCAFDVSPLVVDTKESN